MVVFRYVRPESEAGFTWLRGGRVACGDVDGVSGDPHRVAFTSAGAWARPEFRLGEPWKLDDELADCR